MRVGVTFGAFDLVHAGHILMFKEAKTQCDYLIVGLHRDPSIERKSKNKPVMSVQERMTILEACRYIDEVIPYDTEQDLIGICNSRPIDVRIIGADYLGKDFTGKNLGIPIYYNDRSHKYSSTELRGRVYEAELKNLSK